MKLDGLTTEQLVALRCELEADPANKNKSGIWIYNAKTRKKFDAIDLAIAQNMRAKRLAEGQPVNDAGYSGRQTNRR